MENFKTLTPLSEMIAPLDATPAQESNPPAPATPAQESNPPAPATPRKTRKTTIHIATPATPATPANKVGRNPKATRKTATHLQPFRVGSSLYLAWNMVCKGAFVSEEAINKACEKNGLVTWGWAVECLEKEFDGGYKAQWEFERKGDKIRIKNIRPYQHAK